MGKEDDRHPRFGHPTGSCRLHVRVRDRDAPLARQARSTGRPARPRPSRLRLVLGGRLRAGLDSRDVGILFGDADDRNILSIFLPLHTAGQLVLLSLLPRHLFLTLLER